jgi:hypothetical protein
MHQPRPTDLNELLIDATKRRFDGGTEIDLIAQIEAQQERSELNHKRDAHRSKHKKHAKRQHKTSGHKHANHNRPTVTADIPLTNRVAVPRWKYAADTLLLGPLQIAVGCVGILTSGLALATFAKNGDKHMVEQSKDVFIDCTKTLVTGVFHLAISPLSFVKTLVFGPSLAHVQ